MICDAFSPTLHHLDLQSCPSPDLFLLLPEGLESARFSPLPSPQFHPHPPFPGHLRVVTPLTGVSISTLPLLTQGSHLSRSMSTPSCETCLQLSIAVSRTFPFLKGSPGLAPRTTRSILVLFQFLEHTEALLSPHLHICCFLTGKAPANDSSLCY